MTLSFVIVECLHRILAITARDHGYEAVHVPAVGLGGSADEFVAGFAVGRGSTLVTNNRRDFQKIYRAASPHPGLIVIIPSVGVGRQIELFEKVLHFLSDRTDLADTLVLIDRSGVISAIEWNANT